MVRDPAVHVEVIEKVRDYAKEIGFILRELEFSPIKGPEGNIEYLLHLNQIGKSLDLDPKEIVDKAHNQLTAKTEGQCHE